MNTKRVHDGVERIAFFPGEIVTPGQLFQQGAGRLVRSAKGDGRIEIAERHLRVQSGERGKRDADTGAVVSKQSFDLGPA